MLASLAFVQPTPPAPEVHAPPRPPAAHAFAQMLRQNQAAPAAPHAPVPTPLATPETRGPSDDATPADDEQNARPAQASRERRTSERTPLMRRAAGTAEPASQPSASEGTAKRPGADGPTDDRAAGKCR